MPNRALARTIIALILALTVSLQVAGLAMANPIPWPSTPNQEKPTLTIERPQNNTTYNEADVYLNFTVTKPDSWIDTKWFMPYIGQVASVNAYLDGNSISITPVYRSNVLNHRMDFGYPVVYWAKINQSTSGLHLLNVTVLSYTYYRGPAYNGSHILSYINSSSGPVYQYPIVVSDTVYFTVEQQNPTQSANPTAASTSSASETAGNSITMPLNTLIAVAAVFLAIIVALALLLYGKHRKTISLSK